MILSSVLYLNESYMWWYRLFLSFWQQQLSETIDAIVYRHWIQIQIQMPAHAHHTRTKHKRTKRKQYSSSNLSKFTVFQAYFRGWPFLWNCGEIKIPFCPRNYSIIVYGVHTTDTQTAAPFSQMMLLTFFTQPHHTAPHPIVPHHQRNEHTFLNWFNYNQICFQHNDAGGCCLLSPFLSLSILWCQSIDCRLKLQIDMLDLLVVVDQLWLLVCAMFPFAWAIQRF